MPKKLEEKLMSEAIAQGLEYLVTADSSTRDTRLSAKSRHRPGLQFLALYRISLPPFGIEHLLHF